MNKNDFEKNHCFKSLFNMVPVITSVNTVDDLSKNLEIDTGALESSSNHPISLFEKNNSVVTDYENFCIKNGSVTCYPLKDFDFMGKNIVCHKCYQKFASRSSYQVHIGTNICIKPVIIRNPVYTKIKSECNKNNNLELLNHSFVFRTRQKSYSKVAHLVGDKKKKNNYYYSCTKPKKTQQQKNNNGGEPRKRGRPRKIKTVKEKVQSPNVQYAPKEME